MVIVPSPPDYPISLPPCMPRGPDGIFTQVQIFESDSDRKQHEFKEKIHYNKLLGHCLENPDYCEQILWELDNEVKKKVARSKDEKTHMANRPGHGK